MMRLHWSVQRNGSLANSSKYESLQIFFVSQLELDYTCLEEDPQIVSALLLILAQS